MRNHVGYFEGTDSVLLTHLVSKGFDTVPVSNGFDNHGMHVRSINDSNRVSLLIGYVHKLYAPGELLPTHTSYQDIFHICKTYTIPLLVLVPAGIENEARQLLDDPPDIIRFVDPQDSLTVALKLLEDAGLASPS